MENSRAVSVALAHIDAWTHHDWAKAREMLAPNVDPYSVEVLCTIGDEVHALILITFRIGLGPGGSMVTMARSCLYAVDENEKIKDERETFFILSAQ